MESRGSQEIKDLFINKLNIFIMVKLKTLVMILGFLVGSSGSSYAQGFLDKVLKGLEKTNEVLEQTDKLLGDDDNNTSNQNASRSKRVTGFKIVSPHPDLQIQFKRCAASASTVIIDLVMTWYGDDTQIRLGGQGSNKNITMAYDDHGKQYDCYSLGVSIAGSNYGYSMGVTELFPMDVPMKVRLQIENVSESVLEFKRILIKAGSQNDPITLYNVPITRNDVSQNIIPVESDGEPTGLSPLGKEEDEDFNAFEEKFVADSAFQISRVIFNDLGIRATEEDGEKITQENYSLQRNTFASVVGDDRYETKQQLTDNQCIQTIWIDGSSFLLEYTYTKINGKWFLTKIYERY